MGYIDEAKRFYQEALRELERGKKENNETILRDAGEKAWNAIVQATNFLFEKRGQVVPKNHYGRRKALVELAKTDPKVEEKGLRDRYMAREQSLHEYCFYEGIYDLSLLEKDFEKVKKYIEDIEEL